MVEISDIKKEIKKYRYVYMAVFFIFIVGVFLRAYNFGDYLILKSDQARDALIINQAKLNGISSLPLVGPQIGGTELKLGPVFYYFQFISGKIFGFSPESLAYPDLIFGILTIFLVFLLARKFFVLKISIFLTALSSVSLFLVTFSRFGWNPNSLPFFTFLFAYSFLTAIEKKGRNKWIFLFLTGLSLGIIAQLHLFAILPLSLGLILFLIITKSLNYKEIIFLISIILFLHTPLIINEIRTDGENIKSFYQAKEKKEARDNKHKIYELFFRSYQENSRAMWISLTGNQNPDIISTKGTKIVCNQECKDNLLYSLVAMVFFGFSLAVIFCSWIKSNDLVEKKRMLFIILWIVGFIIFSALFAYQLEIRFYLGIIPLFILLGGFDLKYILTVGKKIYLRYLVWTICFFIVFLNFYATFAYLKDLSDSRFSNKKGGDDLRFENDSKVTLGQLRDIAQEADLRLDKENFLIISGETHYVKAMYYLLSVEYGFRGCYLRGDKYDIDPVFNQLIIYYNKNDDNHSEKTEKKFGTLKASFIKSELPAKNLKVPEGCINY